MVLKLLFQLEQLELQRFGFQVVVLEEQKLRLLQDYLGRIAVAAVDYTSLDCMAD